MALIDKGFTFTAGNNIVASEHNTNFDTIYNDYNGNITNVNIAASAGIVDTKLDQITTANKVSLTALTAAGDYAPTGIWDLTGATLAGASPLVFEGATADAHETTFAITDPTGDRTITFPDATLDLGTVKFSTIKDYGTSASASTTRTADAIKIAYGQISIGSQTTQAITNLPFSSATSFTAVASPNAAFGTTKFAGTVQTNSGAQITIGNTIAATVTYNWWAIGT